MKAYLINMDLLVPRSRSSAKVKVKYKGNTSQKNGRFGGIRVSQTHLGGFFFFRNFEQGIVLGMNESELHCHCIGQHIQGNI